ncbi:MAG: hypothetical protein ACK4E8_12705 [Lacibacter sp.]
MNRLLLLWLIVLTGLTACKKAGSPKDETEHEAINAVDLIFKQSGTTVATFTAEDPDGDGGNPPTRIDEIVLDRNQTYTVTVVVRNISGGVSKDVSANIQAQARDHEFFFIPTGLSITITKNDRDSNGFPVGFNSTWVTGNTAASGTLQLRLMHKPRIKGPNDDPSKGHSDLLINFPARIR